MKLLAIVLATLVVLLQWPLWVGKGSWLKVWQIEGQLAEQQKQNQQLKARNDALDAEVRDLKTGTDAIEERARSELGLIRPDEIFFQVLPKSGAISPPPSASPAPTRRKPSENTGGKTKPVAGAKPMKPATPQPTPSPAATTQPP